MLTLHRAVAEMPASTLVRSTGPDTTVGVASLYSTSILFKGSRIRSWVAATEEVRHRHRERAIGHRYGDERDAPALFAVTRAA